MSARMIAAIAAASAVVLAALAIALGIALAGGEADTYRGSPPPEGIALADFSLRSYTGEPVSRASLEGKVVALTFLESRCKEACPVIAFTVARGMERLTPAEREAVAAVAISTHPDDDTPASVRSFLAGRRALGALDYLVGSEDELRPVWRRFAVLSALDSGDADTHSASVRIFDRVGEWVSTLHPGVDLTPESFAHDVRLALG
jgi:protein SCO1/2